MGKTLVGVRDEGLGGVVSVATEGLMMGLICNLITRWGLFT